MKAQNGKVYKNIVTGDILGNQLWLGCNDKAENYVEVDKPVEEIIPPTETEKTVDQQINEIQTKIDELNLSVDLLVLNSL